MNHFKLIPLEERIVFDGAAAAHILYVNANVHHPGNGLSWGQAFNDLQTAINTAESLSGATQIWVAKGTYVPDAVPSNPSSATFSINDSQPLAIYGGFISGATSLSQRNPTANPTILSGVISGGNVDTIVTINGGTTTVDGFTLSGANNPTGSGGGILEENNATLTVSNDIFTQDSVGTNPGEGGGGIASLNSTLSVTGSTFIGNTARNGGAIFALGDITLTINSSVFQDNVATRQATGGGLGGAVFVENNTGDINITTSTFDHNLSVGADSNGNAGAGGAILSQLNQNANISYDIFKNNSAGDSSGLFGGGGAVWSVLNQTVNFIHDTFVNNAAGSDGGEGGAVTSADAANNFLYDIFTNNTAPGFGGAIASGSNTVLENMQISGCVFTNNTCLGTSASGNNGDNGLGGMGGAVDIDPSMATSIIDHNIFINNSAFYGGGAIDTGNNSQNLTVTANIFIGNKAGQQGGAIWDESVGTDLNGNPATFATANVVITSNLFSGNSAAQGNDIWLTGTINGETSVNGIPIASISEIISNLQSTNLLLDPDGVFIMS